MIVLAGLGLSLAQEQITMEDVQENVQRWQELYNQGDYQAIADLYADDAVFYGFAGDVHEGRDAILEFLNRPLPGNPENPQIEIELDEVHSLGNNTYVDFGRYVTTAEDGTEVARGNYMTLSWLEDGEWRIQRHFINMVLPEDMLGGQNTN